jgi:uncharacterized protein YijF (DUF1287 family)
MTALAVLGSGILCAAISAGCTARGEAQPISAAPAAPPAALAQPEVCLGVADKGVFSDLDEQMQLALPAKLDPKRVSARVDRAHGVLVLSIDQFPRKVYPLGGPASLTVGSTVLALRAGDRDELAPLLHQLDDGLSLHDRDNDGIPDPLDVLIGAKKLVINADHYTPAAEDYISMSYPGGDVPRTIGVCTDVVVRAVRNAGIDLQKELHDDIQRARRSYPMVKGSGDPSIDQRRVGTLLPYFKRHWESHSPRFDDPDDPPRPGDVIFMDTFPDRPGPDHMGIVSDRVDDAGLPFVINNWTEGTVTAEMDLASFVPVLYRFRLPP